MVDSGDAGECVRENPRGAERLDQNIGEADEVRAHVIGAYESCTTDQATGGEARAFGSLDFAMHRRIWRARLRGEIGQRVLDRWVAQDESQQLGLLL